MYNGMKLNMFDGGEGGGADAGAGASGGQLAQGTGQTETTGVESNQVAAGKTPEEAAAEFERYVKGEYKEVFDKRVQSIINGRFKETKNMEAKIGQLSPVLDLLSSKYGVEAENLDALVKAIENDTSMYEEEALEKGMTIEQLKLFKQMQRENATMKKQQDQQAAQLKAQETAAKWQTEATALKQQFPGFDLEAEVQNKDFQTLLKQGIPMAHAYKVVHMDDILGGAMQFTAEQTKQKLINDIQSRGSERALENGATNTPGQQTKVNVAGMSKEDRRDLAKRAARGERITF